MLKKIVLLALLLVPMGAIAQQQIAYFTYSEVIMAMPETAAMQDSLMKTQAAIEAELQVLEEEYSKKYTSFMEDFNTLVDAIKTRRQQEIQDIQERAVTFQQQSQQQLQQLQQQLLMPIQQKIQDALNAVATEQNYLYVLEIGSGSILYTSPSAPDATPLVMRKLGLQ